MQKLQQQSDIESTAQAGYQEAQQALTRLETEIQKVQMEHEAEIARAQDLQKRLGSLEKATKVISQGTLLQLL